MRVLTLFRGAPGCGKSTTIKNLGLEIFTLSPDNLRLMYSSPATNISGDVGISGANEKVVWKTLFQMLEHRMKKGAFTVIDATNSKTSEMERYVQLAKTYRYEIYLVDMTDIPIEIVKERNEFREEIKVVPEEVIERMYERFETEKIPSEIKIVRPEDLMYELARWNHVDLSKYNKLHFFGDIHGCYTCLMDYFDQNDGVRQDEAYIFTGDYVDRGIENAEVVQWICSHKDDSNMFFLEGNHEHRLWRWSRNIESKLRDFENGTRKQLEATNIQRKEVKDFCRKLREALFVEYCNMSIWACHGGVSNTGTLNMSAEDFIRGIGKHDDSMEVDEAFVNNTWSNTYQVHGHRNVDNLPIQTKDRTFNLEGGIEYGGCLRVVQVEPNGKFTCIEIPNRVFRENHHGNKVAHENIQPTRGDIVSEIRNSPHIKEHSFGRISSFNFTRKAFQHGIWNKVTVKARGLYVDTTEMKVVARAYDKFFGVGERKETKMDRLKETLNFPVSAYVKENGFLGIVGWNPEENDLLIATKSTFEGEHAGYFKDALRKIYGEGILEKLREYIQKNDVSFVFECCDKENDLHIIDYTNSKVVLLDVVKNDLECKKLPYEDLCLLAKEFGLEVKEKAASFECWDKFSSWCEEVSKDDYKFDGQHIEGFVLEDASGFMLKIKTYYYKKWKILRGMANSVLRTGNWQYSGTLIDEIAVEFFHWCKEKYNNLPEKELEELRLSVSTNMCGIRKRFLTETGKIGE